MLASRPTMGSIDRRCGCFRKLPSIARLIVAEPMVRAAQQRDGPMRSDQLDDMRHEASRDRETLDALSGELGQDRLECAREIVRAYRSSQPASAIEDPVLTLKILATLEELGRLVPPPQRQMGAAPQGVPEQPIPAVPRCRKIGLRFLTCLEDGHVCSDLESHLQTAHGLTPAQYRERWRLPPNCPMRVPTSCRKRVDWRIRLSSDAFKKADSADRAPQGQLPGRRGLVEITRLRRRRRKGGVVALGHDRAKAWPSPDRHSENPKNDGSRR